MELAKALAEQNGITLFLSLSRQSEMYANCLDIPVEGRFDIDTYSSFPEFLVRSAQLPLLRRRFGRFIRCAQIDIVLCTMDHLWGAFVAGVAHSAGALYMLTVHDALRHPGEDQLLRRWLLRRDVAMSDGALVLTQSVADSLINNHGYSRDRVFVSTHGAFEYRRNCMPRDLPSERPIRLLFFGRIIPYKGLDLLLRAMPLLAQEFPDVSLEIWGSGDITPYRDLIAGVKNIRLENRWIKEEEIDAIFQHTDIAVLPYQEASQSGVVATAFPAGMPCVVTPVAGLREQVAHGVTGLVAASRSVGDLAEAIAEILRNPALYRKLSEACLNEAKTRLSWEEIGENVTFALNNLHALGRRSE